MRQVGEGLDPIYFPCKECMINSVSTIDYPAGYSGLVSGHLVHKNAILSHVSQDSRWSNLSLSSVLVSVSRKYASSCSPQRHNQGHILI